MDWFKVDKEGLAKLLERKGGKQFAIFELIQNSWDEDTTRVQASLEMIEGKRQARIRVQDNNPEGFKDLTHAFTLFAESTKKADPTKRGRFNLGEKLVLACCEEASIATTKGTIIFDHSGRHQSRKKTESGSVFSGVIKMTHQEYEDICEAVNTLMPPQKTETYFNGQRIYSRIPITTFNAALPTECADDEGVLRRTVRNTTVEIYEPLENEDPSIYEMGIKVVDLDGDKYHVNVLQKIPLNLDRDNVPPSYLKTLRTLVLNATYHLLTKDEAVKNWVREGASDPRCTTEAIRNVTTLRFGDKAVAYDPSDVEANNIATSKGYSVIYGGSCSQGEWENIKKAELVKPAGQVTPSPKPFSEDGKPLKTLPEEKWTKEIKEVVEYSKAIVLEALNIQLNVVIANDIKWPFNATYGDGELIFNLGSLGYSFFNKHENMDEINRLLIHELAHHYASNHLSEDYYRACCKVGAAFVGLALRKPELFP